MDLPKTTWGTLRYFKVTFLLFLNWLLTSGGGVLLIRSLILGVTGAWITRMSGEATARLYQGSMGPRDQMSPFGGLA